MIDTHAHLTKRFGETRKEDGLGKLKSIILAASCLQDSEENIKLAKENPRLWPAVGIHPQKVDPENEKTIDEQLGDLDKLIGKEKQWVKAVGETGLDFSEAPEGEENRSKKDQEKLFRGQIEISLKYRLPLIIHARKAMDEAIGILADYKKIRGVFHCYTGGKKRIKKVLELGTSWYFGIDGNVTYEDGLAEVVKKIPQNRLILETDSPLLTPVPHRGEKNKPEYVEFVYKKIAEIWGKSFEETEKVIDTNGKKLFGI